MSTVGVILSTVGVILSTMGDTQYCRGYHDACGWILWVPWGGGGVQYCEGYHPLQFECHGGYHRIYAKDNTSTMGCSVQ